MLWAAKHHEVNPAAFARGDTMPAMFWNGVTTRGDQVWMRQKEFGIWHSWNWQQVGSIVGEPLDVHDIVPQRERRERAERAPQHPRASSTEALSRHGRHARPPATARQL